MREKKTATRLMEVIDKGATTVEEIHKSIAEMPLKVLEEADLFRRPAKEVRKVQDRAIGAIYDLVRDINHEVGKFASEMSESVAHRKFVAPRMKRGGSKAKKGSIARHPHAVH